MCMKLQNTFMLVCKLFLNQSIGANMEEGRGPPPLLVPIHSPCIPPQMPAKIITTKYIIFKRSVLQYNYKDNALTLIKIYANKI